MNNNISFNSNTPYLISMNESMDNIQIYNPNINNNINFDTKKIYSNEKNTLTKSIPLSQILSNHFNKQNEYNDENLDAINDENNYFNNCNYKLNNYKEELNNYKRKRKEEERKRKFEKEREKEYLTNLKILYEKNNKDKIKELLLKNKNQKHILDCFNKNNDNKIKIENNKNKIKEDKKEEEQIILFKNNNNNKLNEHI